MSGWGKVHRHELAQLAQLSPRALRVLLALRVLAWRGPVRRRELCRELGLHKRAAQLGLAELERAGFAVRDPAGTGREDKWQCDPSDRTPRSQRSRYSTPGRQGRSIHPDRDGGRAFARSSSEALARGRSSRRCPMPRARARPRGVARRARQLPTARRPGPHAGPGPATPGGRHDRAPPRGLASPPSPASPDCGASAGRWRARTRRDGYRVRRGG